IMAHMFSRPESAGVRHIFPGGAFHPLLRKVWEDIGAADRDFGPETGDNPDSFLAELQAEYDRLFAGPEVQVPLNESCYKPWTQDPECRLSFAGEKGLMMGDPALHMKAIFEECGLEIPDECRAAPDHLALQLDFLSLLYAKAGDREIRRFIGDHLDWVPDLKAEMAPFHPHVFYGDGIEALDFFLNEERRRLRIG
ncbi:MAG TPA: molecular chaperone TorD family protein, partial [Thermodesulfobacteriota bacterium]|nr:molecular chaperone TorD family protein [Thermodesulfobacteriota bacterium]